VAGQRCQLKSAGPGQASCCQNKSCTIYRRRRRSRSGGSFYSELSATSTPGHLQQRVQTRKLTNLFKRHLTSLLRLCRKIRATFCKGGRLMARKETIQPHHAAVGRLAIVRATTVAFIEARVILSLAVGFGLMALLFCSSRKGYDEPPVLTIPENESNQNLLPGSKPRATVR
jgi:hypothetical protein